jgi:hypothetical protein
MGNNDKKTYEEDFAKQKDGSTGFRDSLSRLAEAEKEGISLAVVLKEAFDLSKELVKQEERTATRQAEVIVNALQKHIDQLQPAKHYEAEMQKALQEHKLETDKLDFEKQKEVYRLAKDLTMDPVRTAQFLSQIEEYRYNHHLHVETGLIGLKFKSTKQIADLKARLDGLETLKKLEEIQKRNADILFSQGKCLLRDSADPAESELKKLLLDLIDSVCKGKKE